MQILAILWASKLFRQALLGVVGFLAIWYIISGVHTWIVEDALTANDKEWQVKLDKEVDKHLDYVAAQEVLRAKVLADGLKDANEREIKYRQAVAQIAAISAQRDSYGRSKSELDSVLKSISSSGPCDLTNAQCRFVTELRRGYASCERDLTTAIGVAGQTNDRARKAELAVKALVK